MRSILHSRTIPLSPSCSRHSPLEDYRCFYFLHVRLATLIIGIGQLLCQVAALCLICILIFSPNTLPKSFYNLRVETIIRLITPTQQNALLTAHTLPKQEQESLQQEELSANTHPVGQGNFADKERQQTFAPFNKGYNRIKQHIMTLIAVLVSFGFTVLLVIGCLKGHHPLLLPFCCLQVLDYFITSITAVACLSHLFDVKAWIRDTNAMPYKENLLRMNHIGLIFLVIAVSLLLLALKFYLITVVWNCYRFLSRRVRGLETSSGFCVFKVRISSLPEGTRIISLMQEPLCERILGCRDPMRRDNHNSTFHGSSGRMFCNDCEENATSTAPLLHGCRDESVMKPDPLPTYDAILDAPANSNMPPPYFK